MTTPSTPTSTMKPDKGEAWREWRQSPGFPAGAETIALQHFDAGFMACWRHPFIRSLVEAQPSAVAGEARTTMRGLAPWLRSHAEHGYLSPENRAALNAWAEEVEAALAAPSAVLPLKGEVACSNCHDEDGGALAGWTCTACGRKVAGEGAAAPSVEPTGWKWRRLGETEWNPGPLPQYMPGMPHGFNNYEMQATFNAAAPVETEQPTAWRQMIGSTWVYFDGPMDPREVHDSGKACEPLYTRPTPAAGVPPELIWTDSDGVTHTMGRDGAIKVLREFFAEWPGGLDEIESSLESLRRRAASPGGVPTGLPTEAIEDAASVLRHIGPQLNAEWAHRCARAAAALSAGAPSSLQGERK